ncbi:MAG: HD domain-containing protein [Candidatus Kapabacteria bacterium]|nr:HD domain-containing protein [Candidatus Kapabacteria bacterium]
MKKEFESDPWWSDHTLKVYEFTQKIIQGENIDQNTSELIRVAAILHDIGSTQAFIKHGSKKGKFQELEGPAVVQRILQYQNVTVEIIERVSYIVGHHHTMSAIDGLDFQVIWEADALVNIADELTFLEDKERLGKHIEKNFSTFTGKKLAEEMYL